MVEVAGKVMDLSVRVQEREVDIKASSNAFIPNLIHSQDAAVSHYLAGLELLNTTTPVLASIHDS